MEKVTRSNNNEILELDPISRIDIFMTIFGPALKYFIHVLDIIYKFGNLFMQKARPPTRSSFIAHLNLLFRILFWNQIRIIQKYYCTNEL